MVFDSIAAWSRIGVQDKHLSAKQDPSRRLSEDEVDYFGWE